MIDPQTLALPRLPEPLIGLRIAHLSDLHLHAREADRLRPRFVRMLEDLHALHVRRPIDLLVLTGDFMNHGDDEPAALRLIRELTARIRPEVATLGVFGNHDTRDLIAACLECREGPEVRWLIDDAVRLTVRGVPLDVLGLDTRMSAWPDAVRLSRAMHERLPTPTHPDVHLPDDPARPLRLMLAHFPRVLPTAADLGVDLLLSGHTHGGQICLPGRRPIKNSSSLPNRLTAGWQRHRDTLLCVSRGLGEMGLPLRVFAPRQLPVYTLTRGPLAGLLETRATHGVTELVRPW